VDDDPHRQPFAVNQGVDLAALDLLARVVTHLVVGTAPFRLPDQTPSRWSLRKML
jgi:hypothetical protein